MSVYVPADGNMMDTIDILKNEQGTASNIKSKATRNNVLAALEKIITHLRTFRKTPENGLAVFSGNISEIEGKDDIQLWSIEPPEQLKTKLYWCDQTFVLEPLKDMAEEREIYGLIVMDSKEATIAILKGKKIEVLRHLESAVPGKTTKGGYSQMRYQHVRDMLINDFLKIVGEEATRVLMEQKNLKGVIIGGPGPNKEDFAKGEYLHHELRKKLLGVKNIGYTDEYGLEELVNMSQDLLKEAAVAKERELLEKFFTELQKNGKVVYGFPNTMKALDMGAVDILLLSEGFDWVHVRMSCSNGHTLDKDMPKSEALVQKCDECGTKMNIDQSLDLADDLAEKALQFGTNMMMISTDTREGTQFKQIGGIGALLRYKI